jgi:hypothetical protein
MGDHKTVGPNRAQVIRTFVFEVWKILKDTLGAGAGSLDKATLRKTTTYLGRNHWEKLENSYISID